MADDRTTAQFFFEMGFGACYAEGMILNGNRPPFPLSDAIIERQWEISQEAYDDHAELDAMLARASAQDELVEELTEAADTFDKIAAALKETEPAALAQEIAVAEMSRDQCIAALAKHRGER